MTSYEHLQIDGKSRADEPNDYYETPLPLVEICLNLLPTKPLYSDVLDIGAGTGIWGKTLLNLWSHNYVDGVEIDAKFKQPVGFKNWYNCDFRSFTTSKKYDYVIGNPPYGITNGVIDRRLAEKFVIKGYNLLKPFGYMLLLLNTRFLESQVRYEHIFSSIKPKVVYISVKRIAWRPDLHGNKANSTSYSVFLWQKHYMGETILGWFNV